MRTAAIAIVCGLLAVFVTTPTSSAEPAATQPYVALHGAGAWSVTQTLVPWQNELLAAKAPIDLNYVKHGTLLGRQDLISKTNDFVISGTPFTDEELSKVPGGASAFISAPVQVATLATFVEPPTGGFQSINVRCDPDDPATWPPDVTDGSLQCVVRAAYTGPVRIPSRNLAAMYLHYLGNAAEPLLAWNHPAIKQGLGVQQLATGPVAGPGFAGRSDPDEINYYWQTFAKTAASDVWEANRQLNSNVPWEPISERVGQVAGITRDGSEQQLAQLVQGGCGVYGLCSNDIAGGVAPAPPSMVKPFKVAFPKQPIALAEMQNANGDWVGPKPDAINKAVDAGGNTPLYALTNKVPGAYPLVWVDRLYAPAKGLSVEKTEGLAMTIRYLATTGQTHSTAVGEGRLSAALVAEALAAADALVRSNCQGSGRHIVTSSDPGPLAPASATAMKSIGSMLHCEAVVAPTTTTTAPSSTPTTLAPTAFAPSDFSSSEPPPIGATDGGSTNSDGTTTEGPPQSGATPPAASGSEPPTNANKPRNVLLTASRLPLPTPLGTTGPDRLAAFALGALLFLLLHKPVGRAVRRLGV